MVFIKFLKLIAILAIFLYKELLRIGLSTTLLHPNRASTDKSKRDFFIMMWPGFYYNQYKVTPYSGTKIAR